MKIFALISFLFLSASFLQTNVPDLSANLMRIYVYFSMLPMSDELFDVFGTFYSFDGQKYEEKGNIIDSNGISKTKIDSRLWYFDIPKSSNTCLFFVKDKEGQTWSETSLYQINGCVFEYATPNYAIIDGATGWHNIGIEMDQFADYFLSRVDILNSSYTNGFMSYKALHDSLFVSLINYEKEKENTIVWNDDFIGSTSFKNKWELMRTSYIVNYSPDYKIIWPYFVGGSLLLLVAGGVTFYFLFLKKKVLYEK